MMIWKAATLTVSWTVLLTVCDCYTGGVLPSHALALRQHVLVRASNVDLFSSDSDSLKKMLEKEMGVSSADGKAQKAEVGVAVAVLERPRTPPKIAEEKAASNDADNVDTAKYSTDTIQERYKEQAAKLRQEAEEMEEMFRQEARDKGYSEELINKFMPKYTSSRSRPPARATELRSSSSAAAENDVSSVMTTTKASPTLSAAEVRSKLGYLNVGDAVRFNKALASVKRSGSLKLWDSKDLSKANYQMNSAQLKAKTNIDPINLRLDDVGFKYQNVFVAALVIGTVLALSASTIGGQTGFLLGYLSALLPVTLVGIGSVAPVLLGEIINKSQMLLDQEAKERFIRLNAGKFLAGYVLGLPVERFSKGGFSNTVDFYQLRPEARATSQETMRMFSKTTFKQEDIARSSVVCLAGSVAECIEYGVAGGKNAVDVNILYELMSSVDPPLAPEKVQDHIRWSAVTAYEILTTHKAEFDRLVVAFRNGYPIEECIAIIESKEDN